MRISTRFLAALGAIALPTALGVVLLRQTSGSPDQNPRARWTEPPESFTSRVIATGLASPWEITWGPDGFLWVTERVGKRVVRINPADGTQVVAGTIDEVYQSHSQDGLLGMALHPQLLQGNAANYVYVAYTYHTGSGPGVTRRAKIRRYTYESSTGRLGNPVDVITNLPHGTDHGGGRLVIGRDLKLYFSRGDQGSNYRGNYCNPNRAQDLPTAADVRANDWSSYQGKILRIDLDGAIPADNPVLNGVRSHVYSYGHRNPQGMTVDPTGRIYASEHGESTDDEVNLVLAGRNYGWPLIAGFQDDQSYVYANWSASSPAPCARLEFGRTPPASVPRFKESEARLADFAPPLRTFFTVSNSYDLVSMGNATIAPAGIDVYTSPTIPAWKDSLLVAALISGVVFRMDLLPGNGQLGEPVPYFKTRNRYRDLAIAPDGRRIYIVTDNAGRTVSDAGGLTPSLANPGSVLEFSYAGFQGTAGRSTN
ncbi:MAG: hypothetical protein A3F70_14895 [Acidobacteria bacterium RIFCSPLOWO2_12_FULL_67_14]|nr:MAG: hypothetical protein A3H29_08815 [Acidobacteria bacterium RIFCSPLOWO2_02_FULL_67_21]OFW37519.1 MAG: hypothetical protein A3F70_14895 [Acidobacteria bacterium RIFCSPLOWO2_12_FULL_67_14]